MSTSLHSCADSEKLSGLLGARIGKIIFALVVAVVVLAGVIYVLGWSKFEWSKFEVSSERVAALLGMLKPSAASD